MASIRKREHPKPVMQIAPMIDCVFLLLIYFMVTSTMQKQEKDISFQLPGLVEQSEPVDMPDEQIIEIRDNGQVIVNDYAYDSPADRRFWELTRMLTRFRQTSEANKVDAIVTVAPADQTLHQYIVRVMDACSKAGIKNVNFAISDED